MKFFLIGGSRVVRHFLSTLGSRQGALDVNAKSAYVRSLNGFQAWFCAGVVQLKNVQMRVTSTYRIDLKQRE